MAQPRSLTLPAHRTCPQVNDLAFSKDGGQLFVSTGLGASRAAQGAVAQVEGVGRAPGAEERRPWPPTPLHSSLTPHPPTHTGEVEVRSFPEMAKVRSLRGHPAPVLSLAFDRQHRWLATGGADAVACLWDAADFICVRSYIAMDYPVRALRWAAAQGWCQLAAGVAGETTAVQEGCRLPAEVAQRLK